MKRFISKNKKEIKLPVPLDSEVYTYNLDCCNACLFTKKLFDETVNKNKDGSRCKDICHTIYKSTTKIKLNFNNLELILSNWGTKYFSTKKEAEKQGKIEASRHIQQMKNMGFDITEKGYILIK